jgi:UDP-GlcNAc:undecaprenyl-phosphate/decaprenyl-phosphate GlcNAc-1-phosphate transferase
MGLFLCVYGGALLLAVVTTPAVIWVARRINAMDLPGVRTVHGHPTPRIGGVAIFLSAVTAIVSALFLNHAAGAEFRSVRLQLGMLLGTATFIFLIGLVDDLKGLPARVKLMAELASAIALCAVGVSISRIAVTDELVLPLGDWGWVLTVLWIVGVTNAVNLSDGLDGLAGGVSAVACAVIAIFALYSHNVIMAIFMLALLGGLCGFLFYNFNPAKVFMGDCGSLFVGFTIAASSMMCLTKSSVLVGLALPALALGIPIFDTFFAILRRFLERRSLFAPDRSHFHHRLIDMGLKQRHAVMAIYAATCGAAGLGLFMMIRRDAGALILFGGILLLLVLLFRVVGAVRFRETIQQLQRKHAITVQEKRMRRTFEDLQLRFRRARDADQWWQAVCEAGEGFSFDSVSLVMTDRDGQAHTRTWRRAGCSRNGSRIVTMNLPLAAHSDQKCMECQVTIMAEPSLECAGHKGALFSRLVDEHDPSTCSGQVVTPIGVSRPNRPFL